MTFEENMKWLNERFEGDDNRSAAALNTLLSAFGGKYTDLNGVEVRVADHPAFGGHMYGNYVLVTVNSNDITVGRSAFDSVHGEGGKHFAFEQADDVYEYVESLCPEKVE
ncbi:MAG: hypothetical protein KGJ13_11000 [Patescibacteria group bacterium]|nr:hypothetical protein [Patescibacteria group bacterium]